MWNVFEFLLDIYVIRTANLKYYNSKYVMYYAVVNIMKVNNTWYNLSLNFFLNLFLFLEEFQPQWSYKIALV